MQSVRVGGGRANACYNITVLQHYSIFAFPRGAWVGGGVGGGGRTPSASSMRVARTVLEKLAFFLSGLLVVRPRACVRVCL